MNSIVDKTIVLRILSTVEVKEFWPQVETLIATALDFSPDVTLATVAAACQAGTYQVIVIERDNKWVGAVVLKFIQTKTDKIAWVMAIGGRWICHSKSIVQFKQFLKSLAVTKLQGIARPSVARLWQRLGVTPLYTVMETNI